MKNIYNIQIKQNTKYSILNMLNMNNTFITYEISQIKSFKTNSLKQNIKFGILKKNDSDNYDDFGDRDNYDDDECNMFGL